MQHDHRETNRRNWDERAGVHAGSEFYDLEGFSAGRRQLWLHPSEPQELGDVRGKSLCHLQCHLGVETLSWARLGASRVVGLDFSGKAIATASSLAVRCALQDRARFVQADVHDAIQVLEGLAPFDIVYVSVGAICWLPLIRQWASIVRSLLVPGGVLYMREAHPMLMSTAEYEGRLVLYWPYFETNDPLRWDNLYRGESPAREPHLLRMEPRPGPDRSSPAGRGLLAGAAA